MPSLESESFAEIFLRNNWSFKEIVEEYFERIIIMTRQHDKNIALKVAY
jgi:hypothetical protein